MVGQIVCSKSGRDKGYFMVVVNEDENYLYVCDGKERPLERPKRKNAKHLSLTNTVLEEDSFKTNKSLKKALAVFRDSAEKGRNRYV
ncbi:MAG: KOW domain-containing RNA-binding protein [Clostridia bacterium]|nr:KOW domain-containing RNA-binding protein [Clostridia bacterium]MBR6509812.1 KOW domain-containing RNA-binding protein [Clostridia bacterium]